MLKIIKRNTPAIPVGVVLWVASLLLLLCMATGAHAADRQELAIEPIYQYNYPSVVFTYRNQPKSVEQAGCGAACVSMVLTYYDDMLLQTPETLLTWALEEEYYTGNGLSCATLSKMLAQYGYSGRWISSDLKVVQKALKKGSPIVAWMGPGRFTSNGHYILIYGIDEGNRLLVIDPNSEKQSKAYTFEQINNEVAGSMPYMICEPALNY